LSVLSAQPGVETPGYCRLSLRDNPCLNSRKALAWFLEKVLLLRNKSFAISEHFLHPALEQAAAFSRLMDWT